MLRIEHASVVSPSDVERMAHLGITAVVQPAFLASEHEWLEDRLGPGRLRRTYPFRTLLDAGVPLAGSSDCPVEPPSPLHGMAAARHRAGIVPDEALTGDEALALFTGRSAAAIGDDAALEIGRPATFTVLDRDPVDTSPDRLASGRALATWVDGGRVAWDPDRSIWPE
jgi:predicted amidohydrolase YtcJ